jgi:Cys-tRNA(Pro)/Cys-tRNA(Cys) deacylase
MARARGGGTTPAVRTAADAGVDFTLHEYVHDPRATAWGEEAVGALGVDAARVFKTLVIALDGDDRRLAVAVVPVRAQLAPKRAAAALGAKAAALAPMARAERATGYVAGGISPLGQRTALPTAVDASVGDHATVFVSAGRRGLEIELAPEALVRLTDATTAPLCAGGGS